MTNPRLLLVVCLAALLATGCANRPRPGMSGAAFSQTSGGVITPYRKEYVTAQNVREGAILAGRMPLWGDRERAIMDLKYQLSAMALDVGYRYMEPTRINNTSWQHESGGAVGGLLNMLNVGDKKDFDAAATFYDKPGPGRLDALAI